MQVNDSILAKILDLWVAHISWLRLIEITHMSSVVHAKVLLFRLWVRTEIQFFGKFRLNQLLLDILKILILETNLFILDLRSFYDSFLFFFKDLFKKVVHFLWATM